MPRFHLLLVSLLLWLILACGGGGGGTSTPPPPPPSVPFAQWLQGLPEAVVTPVQTLSGFEACYRVELRQPVDHGRPDGPSFRQTFYVSHRGDNAPTVFCTTGYDVPANYQSEPARILNANQILLVHRYFPGAMPQPLDWTYCTTSQMARDQHRIRDLFRPRYRGKWVSTGASKGGMTALYYRYYFPADVDATIAYVAPIMEQTDDPRFVPFLASVGTPQDRERVRAFQREILARRTAMLNLLEAYAGLSGLAFNLISQPAALEYSVLEVPFALWQYGNPQSAEALPPVTATDQELFNTLLAVSSPSFYADQDFLLYQTLFYQAYTELGYCPFWTEPVADQLEILAVPSYRDFAPKGIAMEFRPEVMREIAGWLRTQGHRILYIYGGIDPWTAAAVHSAPGVDALTLVESGQNHGAGIRRLANPKPALDALSRWLGMPVVLPAAAPSREELALVEPARRRRL